MFDLKIKQLNGGLLLIFRNFWAFLFAPIVESFLREEKYNIKIRVLFMKRLEKYME